MNADTTTRRPHRDESTGGHDEYTLQPQWHGWGSPIGLGVGLLSVGGFFTLLSLGLSVLSSIG